MTQAAEMTIIKSTLKTQINVMSNQGDNNKYNIIHSAKFMKAEEKAWNNHVGQAEEVT